MAMINNSTKFPTPEPESYTCVSIQTLKNVFPIIAKLESLQDLLGERLPDRNLPPVKAVAIKVQA